VRKPCRRCRLCGVVYKAARRYWHGMARGFKGVGGKPSKSCRDQI
jgi:hypothetical protein